MKVRKKNIVGPCCVLRMSYIFLRQNDLRIFPKNAIYPYDPSTIKKEENVNAVEEFNCQLNDVGLDLLAFYSNILIIDSSMRGC